MSSLKWLRRHAVGWSLPRKPGLLADVLAETEFVQADPIRAPARAQDLILRQRVRGYRVGDLDQCYAELEIDEDVLYAYGYTARRLRPYLHPRHDRHSPDGVFRPCGQAAEILEFVRESGLAHPRDVQAHFGHQKATNDWGGTSSATTMTLERLHHFGFLRVVDRVAGVRRYQIAPPLGDPLGLAQRRRALVLRVARTLAPVTESTLGSAASRLVSWLHAPDTPRRGIRVVRELLARGELEAMTIDGVRYVWPADLVPVDAEPPARVRFLAPFDPVVWDRKRFGHIWGWDYRFEAYTPAAKRVLGYYAMPMLWRDKVIGWANCADITSSVEVGFVDGAPKGVAFEKALDSEVGRLKAFLSPE
ncbi:DNA glycosylase AlkZ-like family protein [Amycolatopsis aidingensis]|uniref:DNA glycosylase AlkZ-like family protein n=1 Tax=Amycolatopsis aidingensis TaxID=2842453 RepID=UPI001C0E3230|nr:crosslink repair DNA glycosylase YcaQ family protein [Amycolatopsis aidingensis]